MQFQTIMENGFGVIIPNELSNLLLQPSAILDLLEKHQFIAFRDTKYNLKEIEDILLQFGSLVQNDRRENDKHLVLDGKKDYEVIRGNGRLPLHKDGLMMREKVKFIAINCINVQNIISGRTTVCDAMSAWNEVPEYIKTALQNGIQVMPGDKSYYINNEDKWYDFEGIVYHNNCPQLNGGLGYFLNENKSWEVRIKDIDEELSYQYYLELHDIYNQDKFMYYHDWNIGDILLLDNRKVLHGREAFEGERHIVQLQVRE